MDKARRLTRREKILAWIIDRLSNWEARISDKEWEKDYHALVGHGLSEELVERIRNMRYNPPSHS